MTTFEDVAAGRKAYPDLPATSVKPRPIEQELALDAIDDAFKSAMVQFAKDAALDRGDYLAKGLERVRKARALMIGMVKAWEPG